MTTKETLIGLLVTIVGGVVVYWSTSGYLERKQQEEHRQELSRQEIEERQRQAEAARQQQRVEEDRRRREKENLPRMSVETNINRNGSDYKDFVASNFQQCLDACVKETQCKAITFTKSSRQCWMKQSVPLRQDDTSYDSAVKYGGQ
jgi:hypothetical protein